MSIVSTLYTRLKANTEAHPPAGTIVPGVSPTVGGVIVPLDEHYLLATEDSNINSAWTSQDAKTQWFIEQQTDNPVAMDPYNYLHSLMNNPFYYEFMKALRSENQNKIDKANELKNMFDLDWFDGDTDTFLNKIYNLASFLNVSIPFKYETRLSDYYGGKSNTLTTSLSNDFYRDMIKNTYLLRKWRGSKNAYDSIFRILGRLGTPHLATKYITGTTATSNIDRYFRLINITNTYYLLPEYNIPSTDNYPVYPYALHLEGSQNFKDVNPSSYYWDSSISWDTLSTSSVTVNSGSTNITFSSVTGSGPYTFNVISVSGATAGYIIVGTSSIYINTSDIASINTVASTIRSHTIVNYSLSGTGSYVILTRKSGTTYLQWDVSSPIDLYGKAIFMEFSLDRLLTHDNSIGTSESLMEIGYNEAVTTLLPEVNRAQDTILVGSQLVLITNSTGYSNSLSLDSSGYSHPSIQSKFQVFTKKNDRISDNWGPSSVPAYIKIGTGGYKNSDIDTNVFLKVNSGNTLPVRIPTDIVLPVLSSPINLSEISQVNNYKLINVSVHPRTVSDRTMGTSPIVIINRGFNSIETVNTTGISFSVSSSGYVSTITVTVPSSIYTTSVTVCGFIILVSGDASACAYTIRNTLSSNLTSCIVGGTGVNVTIEFNPLFSTYINLTSNYLADGTVSAGLQIPTTIINGKTYNQRILFKEVLNPVTGTYDTQAIQQVKLTSGQYANSSLKTTNVDYLVDDSYYNPDAKRDYMFPYAYTNIVETLPMNAEDMYSTLQLGLIARSYFDSATTLRDRTVGNHITTYTLVSGISTSSGLSYVNTSGTTITNTALTIASGSGNRITLANTTTGSYINQGLLSFSASLWSKKASGTSTVPLLSKTDSLTSPTKGWSVSQSVLPVAGMLAPENLTAYCSSSGTVSLTWNSMTSVTHYYLHYSTDPCFTIDTSTSVDTTTTNSATVSSLTNGSTYYFAVRYSTSTGISGFSSIVSVKVNTAVSGAPTNVSAKQSTTNYRSSIITWNPVASATSYNIYWSTTTGVTATNGTKISGVTSPYTHTGRETGTYFYVVTAIVGGVESSVSLEVGVYLHPRLEYNIAWHVSLYGASTAFHTTTFYAMVSDPQAWHHIGITVKSGKVPIFYLDGSRISGSYIRQSSTSYAPDSGNVLSIGGFASTASFNGSLTEFSYYNRVLSDDEISKMFWAYPQRGNPMIRSTGEAMFAYTDHEAGVISFKLRYSPSGPLYNKIISAPLLNFYTTNPSGLSDCVCRESFKTGYSINKLAITELGLFDADDTLLAYATFPPIIYDASQYHTSYNLFIKT